MTLEYIPPDHVIEVVCIVPQETVEPGKPFYAGKYGCSTSTRHPKLLQVATYACGDEASKFMSDIFAGPVQPTRARPCLRG